MKRLFILVLLIVELSLLSSTALNDNALGLTYKNLLWIDNQNYDGVNSSQQNITDASGNEVGFSLSTASLRLDTGYKIEWGGSNMYIYNDGAESMTLNGDKYVKLLGTSEIDLTSTTLIDINAANITIDGSIATTGTLDHTGDMSISSALDVTGAITSSGGIDGVLGWGTPANAYVNSLTEGTSGHGYDVIFYSDNVGSYLLWDDTTARLTINGVPDTDALVINNGDVSIDGDIDVGGNTALSGTIYITGETTMARVSISDDFQTSSGSFKVNGDDEIRLNTSDTSTGINIGTSAYEIPITIGNSISNIDILGTISLNSIELTSTAAELSITDATSSEAIYANSNILYLRANSANRIAISETGLRPTASSYDIGSIAAPFEDGHFEGTIYADSLDIEKDVLIGDDLAVTDSISSVYVDTGYLYSDIVTTNKYLCVSGDIQTLSGDGTITNANGRTSLTTSATATAWTIQNGAYDGQIKIVYLAHDGGGDGTITYSCGTLVFDTVGDSATLMWDWSESKWFCIGAYGIN